MDIKEIIELADEYNFPILPLNGKIPITKHGSKDATTDLNKINQWWNRWPNANVGIATGKDAGLVVIDIDDNEEKGKYGKETLADLESKYGKLPDTLQCLTGSGGVHNYFKYPAGVKISNSQGAIGNWVDVRGDGGYVVAPPSIHPETGRPYEWEISCELDEIAELPPAWIELLTKAGKPETGESFELPEVVESGKRHDILFKYACSERSKGRPIMQIAKALNQINIERCKPGPVPDKEIEGILNNVADYPPGMAWEKMVEDWEKGKQAGESLIDTLKRLDAIHRYRTHDRGYGALFADIYQQKYRYCGQKKDFMEYDGKRWVTDVESLRAKKSAQELSSAIIRYAAEVDESEGRLYLKAVTKLSERRNRENMLADAKPVFPIKAEDLDKNDYILNTGNCTLDLSGAVPVIRQHSPSDLLSKVCNANYDPAARCPVWDKFLLEIMQGDSEKIKYLQKLAGLSLTGNTEQETCFILYGSTTRNGKSTFCETLIYMLGDYALTMRPETLAIKANKDSRQASGDIARLAGCRFVNASEPPKRMLFDTALLKSLLGRDSITARHLHEREFEFVPRFKLVMNTNYLPQISDDTVFSSGRINVVSFDRHFTPEEQDRGLKNRLRDPVELSGILNWCLEGWRLYQAEGLTAPDAVRQATENYRNDSDKIGNFINECLTESGHNSKAGDIYKVYADWCKDSGHGVESKANFFADMKSKGLFAKTGRVDGMPVKNVIKGYTVEEGFMKVESDTILPGNWN